MAIKNTAIAPIIQYICYWVTIGMDDREQKKTKTFSISIFFVKISAITVNVTTTDYVKEESLNLQWVKNKQKKKHNLGLASKNYLLIWS